MHESGIITLFSTLTNEDRRNLRKWIKSDFVNKNKDIVKFFEFIDSKNSFSARTISKEKAHEYIYPNAPYNDLRIRHLMWLTNDIIEEFIAYNSLQKNSMLKKQLLAQHYATHELFKLSNQAITENFALAEKSSLRNASFHLQQHHLYSLYFQINSKNVRNKDFKLQNIIDHATLFMLIETLKYACVIHSIQKVTELKVDNYLLETTLKLVNLPAFKKENIVQIYYHIYLVLRDEDEKAFAIFIKDLKKYESAFTPTDLKDLYLLSINFCVKKSNQNIEKYTQLAFELYVYAIEKKYLVENNEISRFSFTNVVSLGIKLKEFTKTEAFIQNYASLINKEYRSNTADFNKAKVYYANGQSQLALKILLTKEFKDVLWNLNAKYLVLKVLFENKDMTMFGIYLKAFKNYVKRKNNIGYHQTYFINVAKSLTLLMDIYKKPTHYLTYNFDKETPDVDWFNSALENIKKENALPKKSRSAN